MGYLIFSFAGFQSNRPLDISRANNRDHPPLRLADKSITATKTFALVAEVDDVSHNGPIQRILC
jgi:hypothetical protein